MHHPNTLTEPAKHCNLDYLNRISGGNPNFVVEMIRLFLKQTQQELVKLGHTLTADELENTKQIAHKMKSSATMVGAASMVIELKNIESLLATGAEKTVFWEPFHKLENFFSEVKQELEPMLQ